MLNHTGQAIKWKGVIYRANEDIPDAIAKEMGLASMPAQKQGMEQLQRQRNREVQQQMRLSGHPVVILGDPNQQQPSVKQPSAKQEKQELTPKRKPRP